MMLESSQVACSECFNQRIVSIGGEFDRWRLSRSLGGVKTDEVFARLLLNLWENNRRFINAPKRPVVVEEAKVDPSDDAPSVQKSSPIKTENGTLVISKDAKGVFIPSRASTTDDDNEASSTKPLTKGLSLNAKRRKISQSSDSNHRDEPTEGVSGQTDCDDGDTTPAPPTTLPVNGNAFSSDCGSGSGSDVPTGRRAKRITGRPKKFADFTLLRESATSPSSTNAKSDATWSPNSAIDVCGGSFAAARSALASVSQQQRRGVASSTPVSVADSSTSSNQLHSSVADASNHRPKANFASNCSTPLPAPPSPHSKIAASSGNVKEANERLIQRMLFHRRVALSVKQRNQLSQRLNDLGSLDVKDKAIVVKEFVDQVIGPSPSANPSSSSSSHFDADPSDTNRAVVSERKTASDSPRLALTNGSNDQIKRKFDDGEDVVEDGGQCATLAGDGVGYPLIARGDQSVIDADGEKTSKNGIWRPVLTKIDTSKIEIDESSNDSTSTVSNVDLNEGQVEEEQNDSEKAQCKELKETKLKNNDDNDDDDDDGDDYDDGDDDDGDDDDNGDDGNDDNDDDNDENDYERLIDEVLKEKELTYRHLHYSKRAKLRTLLMEDDKKSLTDNDEDDKKEIYYPDSKEGVDEDSILKGRRQRRRRRIVEAFVTEIASNTRRLDAVIADVEGTASLDRANKSKLKEKLKKRVLEGDDDEELKEVVEEFMEDMRFTVTYFEVDNAHVSKRRSDSFEWSRVLNADNVIVNVEGRRNTGSGQQHKSQPLDNDKKSETTSSIAQQAPQQQQQQQPQNCQAQPLNSKQQEHLENRRSRLICRQCHKPCRDGKELQWHMRSVHDEIDAQVCAKCFGVFNTLARLKTHDCGRLDESIGPSSPSTITPCKRQRKKSCGNDIDIECRSKVKDLIENDDSSTTEPISASSSAAAKDDAEKENSPSSLTLEASQSTSSAAGAAPASSSPLPVRLYQRRPLNRGPSQLPCPYPNCGAILGSQSSLWAHKRRHRGGLSSPSYSAVTTATSPKMGRVNLSGKFRCDLCNFRSHSNIILTNHVRRTHDGGAGDGGVRGKRRASTTHVNHSGGTDISEPAQSTSASRKRRKSSASSDEKLKSTSGAHGIATNAASTTTASVADTMKTNSIHKIPTLEVVGEGGDFFRPVIVRDDAGDCGNVLDGACDSENQFTGANKSENGVAFYVNARGWKVGALKMTFDQGDRKAGEDEEEDIDDGDEEDDGNETEAGVDDDLTDEDLGEDDDDDEKGKDRKDGDENKEDTEDDHDDDDEGKGNGESKGDGSDAETDTFSDVCIDDVHEYEGDDDQEDEEGDDKKTLKEEEQHEMKEQAGEQDGKRHERQEHDEELDNSKADKQSKKQQTAVHRDIQHIGGENGEQCLTASDQEKAEKGMEEEEDENEEGVGAPVIPMHEHESKKERNFCYGQEKEPDVGDKGGSKNVEVQDKVNLRVNDLGMGNHELSMYGTISLVQSQSRTEFSPSEKSKSPVTSTVSTERMKSSGTALDMKTRQDTSLFKAGESSFSADLPVFNIFQKFGRRKSLSHSPIVTPEVDSAQSSPEEATLKSVAPRPLNGDNLTRLPNTAKSAKQESGAVETVVEMNPASQVVSLSLPSTSAGSTQSAHAICATLSIIPTSVASTIIATTPSAKANTGLAPLLPSSSSCSPAEDAAKSEVMPLLPPSPLLSPSDTPVLTSLVPSASRPSQITTSAPISLSPALSSSSLSLSSMISSVSTNPASSSLLSSTMISSVSTNAASSSSLSLSSSSTSSIGINPVSSSSSLPVISSPSPSPSPLSSRVVTPEILPASLTDDSVCTAKPPLLRVYGNASRTKGMTTNSTNAPLLSTTQTSPISSSPTCPLSTFISGTSHTISESVDTSPFKPYVRGSSEETSSYASPEHTADKADDVQLAIPPKKSVDTKSRPRPITISTSPLKVGDSSTPVSSSASSSSSLLSISTNISTSSSVVSLTSVRASLVSTSSYQCVTNVCSSENNVCRVSTTDTRSDRITNGSTNGSHRSPGTTIPSALATPPGVGSWTEPLSEELKKVSSSQSDTPIITSTLMTPPGTGPRALSQTFHHPSLPELVKQRQSQFQTNSTTQLIQTNSIRQPCSQSDDGKQPHTQTPFPYEIMPIDIAEEVLVDQTGDVITKEEEEETRKAHSLVCTNGDTPQQTQGFRKSLTIQQILEHNACNPGEFMVAGDLADLADDRDKGYDEDPGTNSFAFRYEHPKLKRIVATNCDHDYSSPGHGEIFVSVLTTDNRKIKFVIE